jgi:hypothetical protein
VPPKARRKKPKPLSDKQRASDDALRESLRSADLRAFDKVVSKIVKR